jgi:hypothetical protein
VNRAIAELQTELADKKTNPEQLKTKVAAVRAARQKAREKVRTTQRDLVELLTADQEAVLVSLGYLE